MAELFPVNQVRFVKELYPRLREDDAAIERYRAALDKLPPIAVARDGVLVDGFHRWKAHEREGVAEIAAEHLGDLSDTEILRESITRNASHGQQLSAKDKQRIAGRLWPTLAKDTRVSELAALLSVSERSVQGWTKDARATEKAEQQARAWDLWLDCLSYTDISRQMDESDETIRRWVATKAQECGNVVPESRQHTNLWNFQAENGYFGQMPPQVVENLLWFYTEPGQVIVDPFAGSGTTIDVAKQMGRRVWASDRKPSTPTLPIHEHDITTGWPTDAPARADLILLDPPYWQQAKGRYSDDPGDLANMTLDDFRAAWERTVKACADRLAEGGSLAFIVSPTLDGDLYVDHAFEMYQTCVEHGFRPRRRIIVPYSHQNIVGHHVARAREQRNILSLHRDLVVLAK